MNTIDLKTDDGLVLPLRRFPVDHARRSVLLLHGGSAASDTFTTPDDGHLVSYLRARRHDVWLLDWRGSNRVAARPAPASAVFSLDAAARYDVPAAVDFIRAVVRREGRRGLSMYGHCLGGAVIAAAISDGRVDGADISSVVMSAMGLFYAAPWEGRIKALDYILERVLAERPPRPTIDVGVGVRFPPPMDQAFDAWPGALRVECGSEVCRQLTFLYGHPYHEANLAPGIHTDARLATLFNHMHLTLFVHCGQNLRRGMYAPLGAPEDPLVLPDAAKPRAANFTMPVTLITGAQNALWHRESIDRMHEWLRSHRRSSVKHVLSGYAHQDLLWGRSSARDVFPLLDAGLSAGGEDADAHADIGHGIRPVAAPGASAEALSD